MKPIACSNAAQPKPHLAPKPPVQHRLPSSSPTPRNPEEHLLQDSASPTCGEKHQATISPKQNRVRRGRVKGSKCLPNGTDKKSSPSGTHDLEETLADQAYPLNIKKSLGMAPNVDFSILRETTKAGSDGKPTPEQRSNEQHRVKSPEVVVADVIYDEPLVEFDCRSLQRIIKSDGYVKRSTDVVEATDPLRKAAHKYYRKRSVRGPGDTKTSPDTSLANPKHGLRRSWSSESVDQLDVLLDFNSCSNHIHPAGKPLRSSFVDPNGPPTRRSVYLELGEYQTLLKHSRNEEERVYSLPQPQCYGEDTLRAVKLITEKYDTFKRRQLSALSFREGAAIARRSQDEGNEGKAPGGQSPHSPASPNAMVCRSTDGGRTAETLVGSDVTPVDRTPEVVYANPEVECPAKVPVEKVSNLRRSGWASLRDYCNTLETDADASDVIDGGLSKSNLMRIELFYRSRETCVYVARCLADLFIGASVGDRDCPMVHQHTGVPVWVLNTGLGVRSRELLLVLAERETGFPLWQDKINYLSNYHSLESGVHCLRVSGSLRKMVTLHMFCSRSGEEFLARFHEIASDPQDDLWKVSTEDRKSRTTGKRKKRLKFSKSSISHPCNFIHISCVDPTDANFRAAFSGLISVRIGKSPTGTSDFSTASDTVEHDKAFDKVSDGSECEFRPRLPTR